MEEKYVSTLSDDMAGGPVPVGFLKAIVSILPEFSLAKLDLGELEDEDVETYMLSVDETPVFQIEDHVFLVEFMAADTGETRDLPCIKITPYSWIAKIFEAATKEDEEGLEKLYEEDPSGYAMTTGDAALTILQYAPPFYLAKVLDLVLKNKSRRNTRILMQKYCQATGVDYNKLKKSHENNPDVAWELFAIPKSKREAINVQ